MKTLTRDERMKNILTQALSPTKLIIENQSQRHDGHGASPHTGESHYAIALEASCLKGLSPVEAQKKVYAVLQEEFNHGLHALSLKIIS